MTRVHPTVRWREPDPTEPFPTWGGALLTIAFLAIEYLLVIAPKLA